MRQYMFYICLIGLGTNLAFVLTNASISNVLQSLLWLVCAYVLQNGGKRLCYLQQVIWSALILKEIAEFRISVKDTYSIVLLILTMISAGLLIFYWNQKIKGYSFKSLLYVGLVLYALNEVIVSIYLILESFSMFSVYTDPCYIIVRTYIGLLAYVMLGIVTWMQRNK